MALASWDLAKCLCVPHTLLTPASPQPCPTHLSTLLSAEEDSASLCSLELERVFKHEGLFREADKHKTMKRKPLASLSLSLLNPNVQRPEQQAYLRWCAPRPWAWGGCPQGLPESPGGENGGLRFPPTLHPGVPIPGDGNRCEQGGGGLVAGGREHVDPLPLLCFSGSPVLHTSGVCGHQAHIKKTYSRVFCNFKMLGCYPLLRL